MNLKTIPEELRAKRQWVCANKGSKVPMQAAKNSAASSTDPATWATFEEALDAVADSRYDYIGYVFDDDGIVGIDIDTGFEDGMPTETLVDIMSVCGSYTEISRSGRGVHIFLKGDLPFKGRNNRNGVEIYRSGRYFITTGDRSCFSRIIENQEAINYVVRKYFPDIEREGGSCIRKIYSPEWKKPQKGKMQVRPDYTPIGPGARNISLTSLAGAMWNTGYTKAQIYKELLKANQRACRPPLSSREVESICNSIARYRR